MNSVLWILQIFLAIVFVWHGRLYVTWSAAAEAWHEKQHPGKPLGLSPAFRTFIGICELLAAVGLLVPSLTQIMPWLTPLAAAGLTLVMIGAMVFHLSRREYGTAAISLVLVALCVTVAYGRSSLPTSSPESNLSNPASVYCEQQGNKLEIVTADDGSQKGICVFSSGRTCDEWAYFRGECGPTK
jgi:putative hemolysin